MNSIEESKTKEAQPREEIESITSILTHAKAKNKWIHNPLTKEWFSPDEFKIYCSRYNIDQKTVAILQTRDPAEGIKAGFQELIQIQIRLESLVRRVNEFYKINQKL